MQRRRDTMWQITNLGMFPIWIDDGYLDEFTRRDDAVRRAAELIAITTHTPGSRTRERCARAEPSMEPNRPGTPDRPATPSEDEPESEAMRSAIDAADAFAALPSFRIPEGLDPSDARRRLILSSADGVALAEYVEQHEPESEDDSFSRMMNRAGERLSEGDAHHLFAALEADGPGRFPAMVIAPLAGHPTSGHGPLDPDNDADAASQRVSSLQVSQLSMRGFNSQYAYAIILCIR